MKATEPCPCGRLDGRGCALSYAACCGPWHAGEAAPDSWAALQRASEGSNQITQLAIAVAAHGIGDRAVVDQRSLIGAASEMSLFGDRQFIELRIPGGKPGKEGSEALREYCENPPPDTVLLITAQDWSRAHAGKWSEAITKVGHFLPIYPLKTHELGDWLQRRLRSRGLVATPDAVRRLADRVEGNLLAAAQEVDKLALLVADKREAIDLAPFDGEAYRSFKQRKPHAQAINQRIADPVQDQDADALFELLSRHDVPVAPVVEPARLAALPQFATRDKFEAGDHMPLVRFPVPLAGMSEGVLGPVPALGSARI